MEASEIFDRFLEIYEPDVGFSDNAFLLGGLLAEQILLTLADIARLYFRCRPHIIRGAADDVGVVEEVAYYLAKASVLVE